ncbi:MAG: multidrug effflux MFS transporter [Marivibrio sp.]|uniref:multidrug effflux MFS transporter n=1 Tax=Marivibrio sp. TaxID=2039719 RepID=UPI0032EC297F
MAFLRSADRATPALSLITALVALGALSTSLYTPSLPAIGADFGASSAAVQRTLTSFLVGFAGAQLVIGPLSDAFGRRPVLLVGLAAYVGAGIFCALATTVEQLTLGRFFQGFAACAGPVVGRAIVRDLFEGAAAARAFSAVGTALAVVPALAPILGGAIQAQLGWEAAFLALAAIGLALLGLSSLKLHETIAERRPDALNPARLVRIYADLLRNRVYMGHALAGGLVFGGFFGYFADAPFLFIGELGIAPDVFGLLMVFTVGGYAGGSYLSGRLAGRWPRRRVILTGTGISVLGALLLIGFSGDLTVARVIGPMCVYTLGFGLTLPASFAGALAPFPRVAGSASAMLGFVQMAGAGAASVAVQPLYDGGALTLGYVVLAMSAAAFLAHAVLARGDENPAKTAPKPGGER